MSIIKTGDREDWRVDFATYGGPYIREPHTKYEIATVAPPPPHIYRLPPGECAYCDAHRNDSMMPPHTPSERCESGKHPHCTCDTCF